MRIVEIISSPEGSPEPAPQMPPRTRSGKQRANPIPEHDVIELTDSEDDAPARLPPSRRVAPAPAVKQPQAGPSRVAQTAVKEAPAPVPLFIPDPDDAPVAPVASSSKAAARDPPPPAAPPAIPAPVHLAPPAIPEPPRPAPAPNPNPSIPILPAEPGPLLKAEADPPPPPPDPLDGFVAQILEIVPDVLQSYARGLVERLHPTFAGGVVEQVLHALFEDPVYPKEDRKGKGKRKREEDAEDAEGSVRASPKPRVDYASTERASGGGAYYSHLALEQLYSDFPQIPVAHVRRAFARHKGLYAPAYLFLHREAKGPNLPYKKKQAGRGAKGKSIARTDEELERERVWLAARLQAGDAGLAPAPAQAGAGAGAPAENAEDEDGIECGCCFSSYPFDKMVQCPEAHLFCTECMTSYAENLLGGHDARIVCMDQSGCKLAFPESELRRFLPPKLLALYERVKQQKEIAAAGLEGLQECPFCEYKVVIDNPFERLFRCENEDCGAVTCLECKKPDHLPKSCKEMEDDKKLDVRHAIEEAMTRALMRNCPNCQKAFVKDMGCNKMTCPNCRTLSCYVCRKVITGYDHFNSQPPYTNPADPKKCALWDGSVEARHSDEVTAAAKRAVEEFKKAHPEIPEEDLKVDLPPVPGPSNVPVPGMAPQVQLQQQQLQLQQIRARRVQVQEEARRVQQQLLLQQRQMLEDVNARLRQQLVYNVQVNVNGQQALPVLAPVPMPEHVPRAVVPAPRRPTRARAPRRQR